MVIKVRTKQVFDIKMLLALTILPIFIAYIAANSIYPPDGFIKIPVAVADEDNTGFSKLIIEDLEKNKSLKLIKTESTLVEKLVAENNAETGFVIKKGFHDSIKNNDTIGTILVYKNPRTISAELIGENLSSSTVKLSCATLASKIVTDEYARWTGEKSEQRLSGLYKEAWDYTENQWNSDKPIMQIDVTEINTENSFGEVETNENLIWGLLSALLMFLLISGTWWLADERKNGTLSRLLTSTMTGSTIVIANYIFLAIIGIVQVAYILILFKLLFGFGINLSYLPVVLAYILFLAGLGMFVSCYMNSIQLSFFIPIFSVITSLLGGCFFEASLIGGGFRNITLLTPQGWMMKGIDIIHSNLIQYNLICIGFISIGILLTIVSFRRINNSRKVL